MAHPGAPTPPAGPPPVTPPATWRDEVVALARLAGPLVAANLLQMAVYAVDVIFVARLGPVPFAAATLGVFLLGLIMWALIGFTGACAPIIAAELGRRGHAVREVRRSFRMAMWLGAAGSLIFMAVLGQGERILLALGQNPAVSERAGAFLLILMWVMLPNVWAGVMRTAAAALGRQGWAIAVTGMALALNLLGTGCWCSAMAAFRRSGWRGRRSPAPSPRPR